LQARESLARLWPDLEKDDNLLKSIDKLALHLPEWYLAVGFLAGILLNAYFSYLESIGFILTSLCIGIIVYRRGFERGCIQGFQDALGAVQRAIDQEDFPEDG
jgi:hypothetical protein